MRVFVVIVAILLTTNINAEKLPLSHVMEEYYEFIVNQQEKYLDQPRYNGLWPSVRKIIYNSQTPPIFTKEYNIFSPLQILLILEEVNKRYILPNYQEVKSLFKNSLAHFLIDCQISNRPKGSICFWPYFEKTIPKFDEEGQVTFIPHNLPNDLDDSSLAASRRAAECWHCGSHPLPW